MLVLSRKRNERILIGTDIVVTVAEINGKMVKIGIDAPPHVQIARGEIADTMWGKVSLPPDRDARQ